MDGAGALPPHLCAVKDRNHQPSFSSRGKVATAEERMAAGIDFASASFLAKVEDGLISLLMPVVALIA